MSQVSETSIRRLTMDDYEGLLALWQAADLPSRPKGRDSRQEIARQLELSSSIYLGVEHQGQLVAAVLGTHDGRKGWINRLAVHPRYRRRGIGRRLVAAVEERLDQQGIRIVACLIEGWNELSVDVFKALGYEPFAGVQYLTKRESPDV